MKPTTRRTALRNAVTFVVPTVTAFALTDLQVAASGFTSGYGGTKNQYGGNGNNGHQNNGHHYGNDKPDTHKVK